MVKYHYAIDVRDSKDCGHFGGTNEDDMYTDSDVLSDQCNMEFANG